MNLRRFVNWYFEGVLSREEERLLSKLLSVYPYRGGVIDEAVFVLGIRAHRKKECSIVRRILQPQVCATL